MSTQTSSPQNPNKINKYENIQGHTSEYFFSVLELIQTVIKHSTEDEISALPGCKYILFLNFRVALKIKFSGWLKSTN